MNTELEDIERLQGEIADLEREIARLESENDEANAKAAELREVLDDIGYRVKEALR